MQTLNEYLKIHKPRYVGEWPQLCRWLDDNYFGVEKPFYLIGRLMHLGFDDGQLVGILETLDDVCMCCKNAPKGCQCWNDE